MKSKDAVYRWFRDINSSQAGQLANDKHHGGIREERNLLNKIVGLGIIMRERGRRTEAHKVDYNPTVIPAQIPLPADE